MHGNEQDALYTAELALSHGPRHALYTAELALSHGPRHALYTAACALTWTSSCTLHSSLRSHMDLVMHCTGRLDASNQKGHMLLHAALLFLRDAIMYQK